MRYYCKECETVLEIDTNKTAEKYGGYRNLCCVCGKSRGENGFDVIPDHETPMQYEGRTGKPYSDNGAVFYLRADINGEIDWRITVYKVQKEILDADVCVIAIPPTPPPADWRPKIDTCSDCGKEIIGNETKCPSCREKFNKACDRYRAMRKSVEGKDEKTQLDAINSFRAGTWEPENV